MARESTVPTPYAVICSVDHKQHFLTIEEYNRQMNRPNSRWMCPTCGGVASFDDSNFEKFFGCQHDYPLEPGEFNNQPVEVCSNCKIVMTPAEPNPDFMEDFREEAKEKLASLFKESDYPVDFMAGALTFTLTEKVYETVKKSESLRLYIYDADGMHSGGQWFTSKVPLPYPSEMIRKTSAMEKCVIAVSDEFEVIITNGGDNTVFHAKDGEIVYPENTSMADFWNQV